MATGAGRLVGRDGVLAAARARLAAGGGVVLTGASGLGKTALLTALATAAGERGELVLRVDAAEAERWLPYAGLADLLAQVPPAAVAALPAPQRAALDAVLLRRGDRRTGGGRGELARRLAWHGVLEWCARRGPVLLVVDDVQWLDGPTADALGFASRRLADRPVRAVVAQREPGRPGPGPRGAGLCPPPATEIAVPPLAADELADLLEAHGLPCRTASRLHAESGGNPYLALALGGAFLDRPGAIWRPVPLPEPVRSTVRARIAALPPAVRHTLLVAALATRPTVAGLRSAGRADADSELRVAASGGLVVLDGGDIRFTPPTAAGVIAEQAGAERRAAVHRVLAGATADPVEAAQHRAMVREGPDAATARSLVAAAEAALRRGARDLVAELYLLAADRTPADLGADRLDWLVAAAEAAVSAGRPALAARAAAAVLLADASPAHLVRARTALVDLAGQALAEMDEMLAGALADAGDDPALLAPLRLRLAWQAMVKGAPGRAEDEARAAMALAARAGDTTTGAMAGAVCAQVERVTGRPTCRDTLARALALPEPPLTGWLHLTPRYLATRFALFDDRLDDARAELLRMLPATERGGAEELAEVLRGLAEVAARGGRCREALDFAARAMRIAEEAALSPGPCWYTAAVAELAGGSVARGLAYAERGVRASEQEHDTIYLGRNLHVVGQARLAAGDAEGAVAALRRLATAEEGQGSADPSVLRWHSDLAAALVAVGAYTQAAATVAAARDSAARLGRSPGVLARLDRSAALVLAEVGDAGGAVDLAAGAAQRFAELGQPVERGHALLVLGQAERRRRRYAAGRGAVAAALAVFEEVGAVPWAERARRGLAALQGGPPEAPTTGPETAAREGALTSTEARIAELVRQGASNREIASRLYVSVKTVEATLTRIYRKLGVRSRTQLTSRLGDG